MQRESAVKRYYNINKILISKIGGWPTQNKFMKILLPTILISLIFSIGYLEFVKLSEIWRNVTKDCESLIIVLVTIGGYSKIYPIIFGSKNIERLLSLIDHHWHIFTHFLEREIMHNYAIAGNKMTISYAVIIYSLMSLFMLVPITPQLLDIVMPLNESRPYKYTFDFEYSFDREEYYYFVLAHSYLTTVLTMTLLVSIDTLYMMFAQHACSLFAAIGRRLENLTSKINSKEINPEDAGVTFTYELPDYYVQRNEDEEIYRELILILRKHQLSIEFVSLLNSSFAMSSFILLFITIMCISFLGIQILSLLDHKEEMARYVAMFAGCFMHIFILNYPGQRIMDHSTDIFYKAYNMEWYNLSRKSIQLLRILFYRSLVPCTLTAGKIYVLSMANYAAVVQTSLSYFTAFSSFN